MAKKPYRSRVSMAYRIDRTPGGRTGHAEVLQTMYDTARMNVALPEGWEITWKWRNGVNGELFEDSFENVITESRAGFLALMLKRIEKDAGRFGVTLRDTALREATEEEAEEIEEAIDEAAQLGAYIGIEKRKKQKRQEAARRGVETRKRNKARAEREAARLHRKRSVAAKKGWETRRRNERKRKRRR